MSKREWTLNIKDGRITSGNLSTRGCETVDVVEKTALSELQEENNSLRGELFEKNRLYKKLEDDINELIRRYRQGEIRVSDMFYSSKGPFKR